MTRLKYKTKDTESLTELSRGALISKDDINYFTDEKTININHYHNISSLIIITINDFIKMWITYNVEEQKDDKNCIYNNNN